MNFSDKETELLIASLQVAAERMTDDPIESESYREVIGEIRAGRDLSKKESKSVLDALRFCAARTAKTTTGVDLRKLIQMIDPSDLSPLPREQLGLFADENKQPFYTRTATEISRTAPWLHTQKTTELSKTSVETNFIIDDEIAQRFNAYAEAAYPNEIGGLLRVVETDEGWRAIDLKIFEQTVTAAYFELDGEAVARFNMELVRSNRTAEIAEWRSLIHSHPSMTPFMSGPDRENIERLAGPGFAFSVICSAESNPSENYYACHYAQGGPVKAMIHNIPIQHGYHSGTSLISDQDKEAIAAETISLCSTIPPISPSAFSPFGPFTTHTTVNEALDDPVPLDDPRIINEAAGFCLEWSLEDDSELIDLMESLDEENDLPERLREVAVRCLDRYTDTLDDYPIELDDTRQRLISGEEMVRLS